MICFGRISLLCCAASRDVSVSAFRARMADAVSAGASAAVEELATSPPTKRTSSITAVAAEDRVRSVSFLLGGTVIGADATWFDWGSFGGMPNRHKRLPSGSSVCIPLLRYSLVCLRNV